MSSKSLFIILGNQLFPLTELKSFKSYNFFMAEDYELCTYEKHHKHKLILFLTSMRRYASELKNNDFNLKYFQLNKKNMNLSYEDKISKIIKDKKILSIKMFEIEDKFFENRILKFCHKNKIEIQFIESPMFLNSRNNFKEYLSKVKKPFMATYYKQQRIQKNILMVDNDPVGKKWSFDEENRKKIPNNLREPLLPKFKNDPILEDIKKLVNDFFHDHPGETKNYWLGSNRKDALKALDLFIKDKLNNFGDYEDAVRKHSPFLFHSVLSPYLNLGLITPKDVIKKVLEANKTKEIPINSLEGFIRQLIGWREFMRGIYHNFNERLEKTNFFNHQRKLSDDWYNGTTGIDPIDDAINDANRYGYAHHIIRLMHLSNVMTLSQIHPKEIYKWFMEMFVDSSDWVMSPNVFGMGTFSDGGIFSTKPYICGSNYILKMSDYKKDPWCDIVDGLYWRFIHRNRDFFSGNPRLALMPRALDRIAEERRFRIFDAAEKFIDQHTVTLQTAH